MCQLRLSLILSWGKRMGCHTPNDAIVLTYSKNSHLKILINLDTTKIHKGFVDFKLKISY